MHKVGRFLQEHAVGGLLIALFVFLAIVSPRFLQSTNLTNVLEQASLIGIVTIGAAILLISGNFDLSVGGQCALVGVVAAGVINDQGLAAGIGAALVLGLFLGAANGVIVVFFGIHSLMATLGTGAVLTGAALIVSSNAPIILTDPTLNDIVTQRFLGISLPVWMFVIVALVAAWYLHGTVGGRETFATGANYDAARYAGVRTNAVRLIPYMAVGVCTAIASLLLVGQVSAGLPEAGLAWPLQVITAVVIGGISIFGGRGTILMAVIGVMVITVASNGFNLLGLPSAWQEVFTGSLLVLAVGIDRLGRELRLRRERDALVRGEEASAAVPDTDSARV